jgi:hypothetical protein
MREKLLIEEQSVQQKLRLKRKQYPTTSQAGAVDAFSAASSLLRIQAAWLVRFSLPLKWVPASCMEVPPIKRWQQQCSPDTVHLVKL